MVHHRSLIILATVAFILIVSMASVQAGQPTKPGKPGLDACLAQVEQLQQTIATQEATIGALQGQIAAQEVEIGALQAQIATLNASLKYKLPKTGQKAQTYYWAHGSDGELQLGMAWPDPRFTDNGNETVTDNLTDLVWTKNSNIFGTGSWYEALANCYNMPGGWRLPNRNEFLSIIDINYENPYDPNFVWHGALPAGNPFTNPGGTYYWTSSISTYNFGCTAWAIAPWADGSMIQDGQASGMNSTWCVRNP